MKAIEVVNSTGYTLEGGNCVVLEDEKYIGESFIVNVKPSEPQLVSYAVEKNIVVNIENENNYLPPYALKFKNTTKNQFVNLFKEADKLVLLNKMVRKSNFRNA